MVTPRLDSAKDGAVGQDGPDEGVQDAAQTAGEDQTLLSSDSASRKSYPRESRWYTVAGYKVSDSTYISTSLICADPSDVGLALECASAHHLCVDSRSVIRT